MGYCMSQNECSFHIDAADVPKAIQAMQELSPRNGPQSLGDILEAWCWELDVAESGNIRGIKFTGEKSRDELVMFKAIAPFVKAGSYIEMSGEDGALWRYVFDGTTCKEVYAKISWE